MNYATKKNSKVGDIVLIPIRGETGHDEQICMKYKVVLALQATVKEDKQIVGTGQEPLPDLLPFNDEIAFVK